MVGEAVEEAEMVRMLVVYGGRLKYERENL
jgi:hypothetical protein